MTVLFFVWIGDSNGRILYVFIEQHSYKGISLGLTFTLFHALGLLASAWLTGKRVSWEYPGKLMLLLCLLVMALNLNGGLILNVVYPSYAGLESIAAYFRCIPYLAVLLIFFLRPGTFSAKLHPVYLSAALMGFSFISFALLTDSLPGYFLTETFNQIAFALLDLFVWTVFGNIAQNSRKPSWIFGLGLFANVTQQPIA